MLANELRPEGAVVDGKMFQIRWVEATVGPGELIDDFVMMADALHSHTTNGPFSKRKVYILKEWACAMV